MLKFSHEKISKIICSVYLKQIKGLLECKTYATLKNVSI